MRSKRIGNVTGYGMPKGVSIPVTGKNPLSPTLALSFSVAMEKLW